MTKYFLILFMFVGGVYSCRPVRKVVSIQTALDKKDTVQKVIVAEIPKVDSNAIVKDILEKASHRKINFNTFNAKIKVQYFGNEESQNFTAYVSMRKDSVIWLQLKGFLGIVGLQARITKDSVIVVNKVNGNWIKYRSIDYLNETTQIPFDFYTLQDVLIGNPIFMDSNVVSYKTTDKQILVMMIGKFFKNLLTLDKNNLCVLHSKLDDVDVLKNRTCDITLSNYEDANGFQFSTNRSISVAEKMRLDFILDFKEYNFNELLKYQFTFPKNYPRK